MLLAAALLYIPANVLPVMTVKRMGKGGATTILHGVVELAQDHRPNQHMALHASELHTATAEVQGAPDGSPPGLLQDRIGEILLRMTGEGRGGVHHDAMLRPEWRKLGVGIASPDGRLYFTVDFAGP